MAALWPKAGVLSKPCCDLTAKMADLPEAGRIVPLSARMRQEDGASAAPGPFSTDSGLPTGTPPARGACAAVAAGRCHGRCGSGCADALTTDRSQRGFGVMIRPFCSGAGCSRLPVSMPPNAARFGHGRGIVATASTVPVTAGWPRSGGRNRPRPCGWSGERKRSGLRRHRCNGASIRHGPHRHRAGAASRSPEDRTGSGRRYH